MYKSMPEHTFYVISKNDKTVREFPFNVHVVPLSEIPWDIIDVGYAITIERFRIILEHGKPCVFHIDQVPQEWDNLKELKILIGDSPVCYWSKEESEMWQVGTPIIRPHPIDITIFRGYKPTKEMAITIATRSFNSWGPDLKGYSILKDAYKEIPIQVIAGGEKDFPNAMELINTEEDMIKTLQDHQVYFNCAWKLDRSPLEAMAIGLPVVDIKTEFNVYKEYFNKENNNIVYANDTADMINKTRELLADKNRCFEIGVNARGTIREYWTPALSNKGWNKAFNLAIKL
jgi:hypothetical protein